MLLRNYIKISTPLNVLHRNAIISCNVHTSQPSKQNTHQAAIQLQDSQPSSFLSKTRSGIPMRALFLGPPGSGKGTQTQKLTYFFEFSNISSGNILRQNISDGSDLGKKVKKLVDSGNMVSDDIMVQLTQKELLGVSQNNWILDGFPRTVPQAKALDAMLDAQKTPLNIVMYLDVPFDVILARITERYVHIPSGRVYNLTYNPPIVPNRDDITAEPLTHRPDDNPEIFKIRLETYKKLTFPLLEYYHKKGILQSFSGTSSDIIFPKIHNYLLQVFTN
ncbi:hypothetical protein BB561_002465 [Smittium simulii]|uniref:GTP:AMP phosphotransferase, mitochondrial n=1 Tax=Smittium simulii TaxID=133385 RepID=A0A2T9YQM9_9FUNG|nr:hypothetical protein BB561_002465 [Smittium simulii]